MMTFAAPLAIVFLLAAGASCDSKPDSAGPAPEFSSVATSSAGPTTTATPAKQATSAPPVGAPSWPTPENCISYNPSNVTKSYESGYHVIKDGNKELLRLAGGTSDIIGQQGLSLAKRYKKLCFLGKGNNREENNLYTFEYWRDSSGSNPPIPEEEDNCSDYDRNNLTVEDMGGGDGWRVLDHNNPLQLFNNESDARNGKLVLAKYSKICRLGDPDDNGVVISYFP